MPFDPQRLTNYPLLPGVYLMKSQGGTILYIGKAKNLRQRLRQYFIPGGDGRPMIPQLVFQIETIDTIIVSSEKEALLLENNLIKQHQPKYNALFKDDKSYIALKITQLQNWPSLHLARYKGKPKGDGIYFGPYTSAAAARGTFDLLKRMFPLRQCSDQEFIRRTRPCILYDMKRCCAPCVGKCTKQEYDKHVDNTIKFLRGQNKEVLDNLYKEMQIASEALEFERAASLLSTIRQIEKTIEGQKVDKPLGSDTDVLAIFRQGEEVSVSQLIFREGKLTSSHNYNLSNIAEDDSELLQSFMLQHYENAEFLPEEILLPLDLPEANTIAEILSLRKKRKVAVFMPQRGEKKALLAMTQANAEAAFRKDKDVSAMRERTLLEMQDKFRLSNYPRRIECFDNSNLGGSEPVSALVAFTNGQKDSPRYRTYKIKTADGYDDYSAMREVLERRCKRGKDESDLPDLIIVDGGKGHLNAALHILSSLDIITVDVIGVAKEEGRHDKGVTQEQIFLPKIKDPILLRSTSPILFLLQQIRDEAHRVAIRFQRKRRSKRIVKSTLDDIPGIGPAKRKLLLSHFGSVKRIREATIEELLSLKRISKANAKAISEYFMTHAPNN